MNARLTYWSDSRLSIESINDGVPRTPKRQERTLGKRRGPGTRGGQDLTSHDESPRTSKPFSSSEEPDNKVLKGYCGANESGNPSPFHIKPKVHAEEEEMSEDERRRSELLGDVAKDNSVHGKSRSREEKAARPKGQSPRVSQGKAQVQRDSYERIMEEQF